MNKVGYHILRTGMGVTFAWIGILILQDPASWWGGYVASWAASLAPLPGAVIMTFFGIMNVVVGILFLTETLMFHAATYAAIHIFGVLVVSGINSITIRDIGLLAAAVALSYNAFQDLKNKRF